jgi:uncharacterized protein YukE
MAQMGMDVESVESVGRQLKQSAAFVDQIVGSLDKSINGLLQTWNGPGAQRFVQQTWPTFRKSLIAAQANIAGLGQSALNNASEQREASGARSTGLSSPSGAVRSVSSVSSDPGEARVETRSNGTTAHVVDHPDAKTTVTDDAQSGLHGSRDGKVGPDDKGNLAADGSLHGEAGIRASETTSHDLGNGVTASTAGSSFFGAEGSLDGTGSIGVDGAKLEVGGTAFAGSDASIQTQFSGSGVTAGIGAGVLAGFGAMANGHVDIGLDHISMGGQLGASLGVGLQVKPSIDFSPKQIVNQLFGVHW